ncbi:hypothetical protein BGZ60DRAFT_415121 [Tricladium varicosporioides]|nr:hypothetical protein BGZ60DRAFT_415121 [Hymenoscyphus varicosporioides]
MKMPKHKLDSSKYQTRSPLKMRKTTSSCSELSQYLPEESLRHGSPTTLKTKVLTYKQSSPDFQPSLKIKPSPKIDSTEPLSYFKDLPKHRFLRRTNLYQQFQPASFTSIANETRNSHQYCSESAFQNHMQDTISSNLNTTNSTSKSPASVQTSIKSRAYLLESPEYMPMSPEYILKSPQYIPESRYKLKSSRFQSESYSQVSNPQGGLSIKDNISDTFSLPPTADLTSFPTRSKVREWSSAFPEEEFLKDGIVQDPLKGKFGWKLKEAERARTKIAEIHGKGHSGYLDLKAEQEEDDSWISDLDIGEPLLGRSVRIGSGKGRKRKDRWGYPTHREFHNGKKVYFLNQQDSEIEANKLNKRRSLQKKKSGLGRSQRVMKYNQRKGPKAARGLNGRFVSKIVRPEE